MAEVKSITNIGQTNTYGVKSGKAGSKSSVSFSDYMKETKSLDDIFEEAAQKYNVSANFLKAIGKAESDFDTDAVSRCGAQGVMQLMPATAASLGVTDSFDPEQNIMGGAHYISDLLKQFNGDTKLALAAYNAGPNNVTKYGGIPPFEETQNYVVKVTKYLQQNLKAGDAEVSSEHTSGSSQALPAGTVLLDWYQKPSQLTQNTSSATGSTSDILDSIFSYQDYLKFLDILLDQSFAGGEDKNFNSKSNYII
jgi:hypothetical protein